MRIAIIGAGLIGAKRARALASNDVLLAVADRDLSRATALAQVYSADACADWHQVVNRADIDAVVVATTNDALAPITLAAVRAAKHVLVEKPAARNADELAPVAEAVRHSGMTVKVGFNHRFHPALLKAREIFDSPDSGALMYIRARYGHGGRIGYDKEWRADPAIAGGGEMLDQGVHLIDLARWFAGDFPHVAGHVGTFFWKMPVEDNGFAILRTATGQVAHLHASCTEWKNLFSFEIFCRHAKLQIDGLGGSYGIERLTHYQMLPQMGPPATTSWEWPFEDRSWHAEWSDFKNAIAAKRPPCGTIDDALAALRIIDRLYRSA